MTKEALTLALEALESCDAAHITDGGRQWYDEKLVDKAITAIKEALANEALEKMAENARELGLDYEPEQDWIERERAVGYREGHQNAIKQMAQPEQEPVGPEPFGFFQYDIRLDAWVQNRINNKGVAFYTKEKK